MDRINRIELTGHLAEWPRTSWLPSGERCIIRFKPDGCHFIEELFIDGELAKEARKLKSGEHITISGRHDMKKRTVNNYGRKFTVYDPIIHVDRITPENDGAAR